MSEAISPRLLSDEQVRRFICDGVLVIDADVEPAVNDGIYEALGPINTGEGDFGGNVLPQVPDLKQILDSPPIHGALQSLLGEGYAMHPLTHLVPSEPLTEEQRGLALSGDEDGPPMGEGSRSYSYWHKDTYVPLGRVRHHVPKYLFMFYFPQHTPVKMGPTRVIPGTQYQDHATEDDRVAAYVPDQVRAGSCIFIAYDIDHAGTSNLADQTRFMVKFMFQRTRNPQCPSWDGGHGEWRPPASKLGRFEHPETWASVWNWMRGEPPPRCAASTGIDQHLDALNGLDQPKRLAAIYSLAAIGEPALEPLRASLLRAAGKGRIEPPYFQREDGSFAVRGEPHERRWDEGGYTIQDEAFALGFMGSIAIDPLVELLDHADPWIVVNAAFALGENGCRAASAVPKLANLLGSSDQRLVRAALESIAGIGCNTIAALPAIRRLLATPRDAWAQELELSYLVGDQIHFNAVFALQWSDLSIDDMAQLLFETLARSAPNICVPALALQILCRQGDPDTVQQATDWVQRQTRDGIHWPQAIMTNIRRLE